jgi:hypothetical protein
VPVKQLWYENITEIARSAEIVGRHVEKCVETQKKRGSTKVDAYAQTNEVTSYSRKDEKI